MLAPEQAREPVTCSHPLLLQQGPCKALFEFPVWSVCMCVCLYAGTRVLSHFQLFVTP